MKKDFLNVKSDLQKEQQSLKAAKTKEDLNNLFKGRVIIVTADNSWKDHRCAFVEMVGEGDKREKWKMKVKTQYGTFLELSASEVMITTHSIMVKESEVDKIAATIKKSLE